MKILVTGSSGFIGKHLVLALRNLKNIEVIEFDLHNSESLLDYGLHEADVIYHLAGVNRPQSVEEFKKGNYDFTESICTTLSLIKRRPTFVLSSSIQSLIDNPYGRSKKGAEEVVESWAKNENAHAYIFRLKNVFGKWCRPNYNSVTATFCHNIANDLPIMIADEKIELELVYIDDVVNSFLKVIDIVKDSVCETGSCTYLDVERSFKVSLGDLASKIRAFKESRSSLQLPSLDDVFIRCLYATYLSYLKEDAFSYSLVKRSDPRGDLAEFVKQPHFGQVFVSRTKPGVTRGDHYHHTKVEKFFVVEGNAVVRFRRVLGSEVIEYPVSGTDFKVIDIPPGYVHSIQNVGSTELVTLFWASEIFDPARPDCYYTKVIET